MKIIQLLPLALLIASCGAEAVPEQKAPGKPKDATLTVAIRCDHQVKSTADWSEAAISSASVYVFNSDGTLDGTATGTTSHIDVRCSQGSGKTVYVVANKTISGTISTEAQLAAVTTSLTDCTASHFVMAGFQAGVEVTATAGTPVEVDVTRFAAKVSIEKITNAIASSPWNTMSMTIKGIYLINAVGGPAPLFGSTYSPTEWYNKMQYVSGAANSWLYESMSAALTNGSSHNTAHTFYCFPNNATGDANGGTWSPRQTRLVVEVQLGSSNTFYYPVTINGISRNTAYTIRELKITRTGSSSPDYPVNIGQFGLDITVSSWGTTDLGTINI